MRCFQPIPLRSQGIQVPCGRCAACLSNRQQDWITRLLAEMQVSYSAYFLTLTYDDQHLPIDENGNPYPRVKDYQGFLKAIRQALSRGRFHTATNVACIDNRYFELPSISQKVKYYLTTEYGSETLRPHAHLCIFNLPDDIYLTQLLVQSCWKKGFSSCEVLTPGRVNYCTKYLLDNKVQPFIPDDYVKPFALMSKNLGLSLLTEDMKDWWRLSPANRVYVPDHGKKLRLSRYYKDRLFDSDMKDRIKDRFCKLENETEYQRIRRVLSSYEYERQVRRSLELKKLLK